MLLGGRGLASGCALVAHAVAPDCAVVGVEPAAGDDARQSMEAGHIVKIATPRTIADGAQTTSVGDITFALMQRYLNSIVTVDDAALGATMRLLAERMKIIVEPTGCLAPAAALAAAPQWQGRRVGILLSGGNIDITTFSRLVG